MNIKRMTKAELTTALNVALTQLKYLKKQISAQPQQPAEPVHEFPDAVKLIQLKNDNDLLMQTIEMSCRDHCPYHQDKTACQNCTIWKNLSEVRKHLQENR